MKISNHGIHILKFRGWGYINKSVQPESWGARSFLAIVSRTLCRKCFQLQPHAPSVPLPFYFSNNLFWTFVIFFMHKMVSECLLLLTGKNVPNPTWSVTNSTSNPRFFIFFKNIGSEVQTCCGAAIAPSFLANTVWYRSLSEENKASSLLLRFLYGGKGICPILSRTLFMLFLVSNSITHEPSANFSSRIAEIVLLSK